MTNFHNSFIISLLASYQRVPPPLLCCRTAFSAITLVTFYVVLNEIKSYSEQELSETWSIISVCLQSSFFRISKSSLSYFNQSPVAVFMSTKRFSEHLIIFLIMKMNEMNPLIRICAIPSCSSTGYTRRPR